MDGHLLALAREEKENQRQRAMREDARRRAAAYAGIPRLREIDARLIELVGEAASAIFGGDRTMDDILSEGLSLQVEREELLTAHHLPTDWLDGAWSCPKCRDTGFIEGRMCDCLRRLYDQQRKKSLSALLKLGSESFETFDLRYYSDDAEGAAISPREQMRMVYEFCRDYAEHFGKNSVNLLFRGDTGLGKTFLSACVARVVSEKGFSVVYETTVNAIAAFEAQRFRYTEEADALVERLTGCELLILDDLGTEMTTDFSRSAVYTLINARLLNGTKTIISTNLSAEELRDKYTAAISSRIEGEYQDLPFVGRDIRQIKKERGL